MKMLWEQGGGPARPPVYKGLFVLASQGKGDPPLMSVLPPGLIPFLTVVLLFCSNVFMTFAWYGHLKYVDKPLLFVIVVAWAIAFFEYCLQVPANRIGYRVFTAAQLKTIQEIITLFVFAGFSTLWLGEPLHWNHAVGFFFIVVAAFFIFHKW